MRALTAADWVMNIYIKKKTYFCPKQNYKIHFHRIIIVWKHIVLYIDKKLDNWIKNVWWDRRRAENEKKNQQQQRAEVSIWRPILMKLNQQYGIVLITAFLFIPSIKFHCLWFFFSQIKKGELWLPFRKILKKMKKHIENVLHFCCGVKYFKQ